MKRHLVLVGLPGSGKSTVGREVARILDTAISDLDELVVSAAGMAVAEVFATQGEARFRQMERAAMDRALATPPHVIAPGAGWIVQPSNLESASGAFLIYLQVPVEVAAGRLAGDTSRPLLSGEDPTPQIRRMLAEREGWYRRAAGELDGSASASAVAQAVVGAARKEAGW